MTQHSHPVPLPTEMNSDALRSLLARGYVNQCTSLAGLDTALQQSGVPVYVGFDATADSLHVGHLLPIMMMRRLQAHGHKLVILIGGGTTRIGDPSFRSEVRPMLDDAQIARNIAGIRSVFGQFLTFGDGPGDAVLVNNATWLDQLKYSDVLRDVGRHFSVNRMLTFDSVRSRLDRRENLSFLEFNYMILQAYDFLELFRRSQVRVQMGGADQWANILNGVDLVRWTCAAEVFGLTAPLLTTASGIKMGKTAAGAVWLNAHRLSPFDYWQFWRNVEDADVTRFLHLFTDLPEAEIASLVATPGAALNQAKVRLANEATRMAHGVEMAAAAASTATAAFGGNSGDVDQLPHIKVELADTTQAMSVVEMLVRAQLAPSKSEARRLILGRGIRIGGVRLKMKTRCCSPPSIRREKYRFPSAASAT